MKLVALMFGAIYYDQKLDKFGIMNINGALFVSVINLSFMNLYPIMTIFSTGETESIYYTVNCEYCGRRHFSSLMCI